MGPIKVVELYSDNWNIYSVLDTEKVGDRTMREYLMAQDIDWEAATGDNIRSADLLLFKGVMDLPPHPRRVLKAFRSEVMKRVYGKPFLTLMGEPREHCRLSYLFSDKEAALCVAPGEELDRIFLPADWKDPRLEGWKERQDRFCWIGRPMPDRIRAARELVRNGIDLDIYSKKPWPLECWKGFASDDYQTAMGYKYRIVFENYPTHRYHSEKLFLSVRSGCVTFYRGDPELNLPGIRGLYVPYSLESIVQHAYDEKAILVEMNRFMHSEAWKMYSYQSLMDTVIEKVHQRIDRTSGR